MPQNSGSQAERFAETQVRVKKEMHDNSGNQTPASTGAVACGQKPSSKWSLVSCSVLWQRWCAVVQRCNPSG